MSVIKEACSPSDTALRAELKQDESKWVAGAQCILPAIAQPTVEQIDVSIIRVIKTMSSRTKVLKKKGFLASVAFCVVLGLHVQPPSSPQP